MKHKDKGKSRKWKVKCLGVATLLAFTFSLSVATAQEGINVTGANASGSGGSASYTVGQMVYQTHTGTNGSVAEGVQQPYEISIVTAIEKAHGINLSVSAYPNPVADHLTLEVNVSTTLNIQTMSYQLYDLQGKLLQNEKITSKQTSIMMNHFVPATYFIKVLEGTKEIKTFKIIKN